MRFQQSGHRATRCHCSRKIGTPWPVSSDGQDARTIGMTGATCSAYLCPTQVRRRSLPELHARSRSGSMVRAVARRSARWRSCHPPTFPLAHPWPAGGTATRCCPQIPSETRKQSRSRTGMGLARGAIRRAWVDRAGRSTGRRAGRAPRRRQGGTPPGHLTRGPARITCESRLVFCPDSGETVGPAKARPRGQRQGHSIRTARQRPGSPPWPTTLRWWSASPGSGSRNRGPPGRPPPH
jgi:hypothetical protein